MFFRTKTTRSGKALQLVESYRNREGKPRQRIVVSLGDLQVPEEHRKELARLVEDALYGVDQEHLISPETSTDMEKWVDYIVKRVEREGKWAPAKGGQKAPENGRDVPCPPRPNPTKSSTGLSPGASAIRTRRRSGRF